MAGSWRRHVEPAALLADAPPRDPRSRRRKSENAPARENDRRQATNLVAAGTARSGVGAALYTARRPEHLADRGIDLRRLRRDQSLLDADHRHRGHLYPGVLCGGRYSRFLHSIPFHQLWGAVVAAAPDWGRCRIDLRRDHRAAGDAPRRLLLCAVDPWTERTVPGLFHHLAVVRRS